MATASQKAQFYVTAQVTIVGKRDCYSYGIEVYAADKGDAKRIGKHMVDGKVLRDHPELASAKYRVEVTGVRWVRAL